jgi:ankyrin repeat protein
MAQKLHQSDQGSYALADIVAKNFNSLEIERLDITTAVSEYLELTGWFFLLIQTPYIASPSALHSIQQSLMALRNRIRTLTPKEIALSLFSKEGKLSLKNAKQILGFQLLEAAEKNEEERFSYLLSEGLVDPNALNGSAKTTLCRTAAMGKFRQVKELIAAGANVNDPSTFQGWTTYPLREAASKAGNQAVVELLLFHKANVHATSSGPGDSRWDALMAASYAGELPNVQTLLRYRANVRAKDKQGNTALMLAALQGGTSVARALTQGGSDLSATNNMGKNALEIAQKNGHEDTAQAIVEEEERNLRKKEKIKKIIIISAIFLGLVAITYRFFFFQKILPTFFQKFLLPRIF